MDNKRIKVMDYMLDPLTMDETVSLVDEMISKNRTCQHVVLNAGKVVLANNDPKLIEIINRCEIINADGQSIVWAARALGRYVPERVAGIDLMYRILALAETKKYGVYFFGAKEDVLNQAVQNILTLHPKLVVAGTRNGYFTENELPGIIDEMKKSAAKILFVGFSSPKKEYWLNDNIDKIGIPFCMGVGGSFDVAAGLTKRAPEVYQKLGLEWFFRLVQEPGRMWKRYLIGNSSFIWYVIKCKYSNAAKSAGDGAE